MRRIASVVVIAAAALSCGVRDDSPAGPILVQFDEVGVCTAPNGGLSEEQCQMIADAINYLADAFGPNSPCHTAAGYAADVFNAGAFYLIFHPPEWLYGETNGATIGLSWINFEEFHFYDLVNTIAHEGHHIADANATEPETRAVADMCSAGVYN